MSTKTRRCVGSERFGIEPHDAPEADFPKQPSQPDGLGRMCRSHWREYTAGLRKDALARKGGEPPNAEAPTKATAADPKSRRTATKATSKTRSRRPSPKTEEVERAEALIAEVDALPADEAVRRVGDADVQQALEVSATAGNTSEGAAP